MATLETAMRKYADKAGQMAANYEASKGRMQANYAQGVARFLGSPPASNIVAAYQAGISRAQYRPGDPQKWATNYRAKMTGG